MMRCAAKTASTHNVRLKITYTAADVYDPERRSVDVSSAKVEKVVKPPHSPTRTKSASRGLRPECFTTRAAMRPMAKEPMTLIILSLIQI